MGRSHQLPRRGGLVGPPGGPAPDDAGCPILHVDMDAFYASVEALRHPELAGRPLIVGGTGPRGVVCSASYDARVHGVRSAMPMGRARRLCPQAAVVPPDMARYAEVSRGVMEIFRSVTPYVEPLSLDEAFLDVAGAVRRLGSPASVGELIRAEVADRHGVTCSVGVASTKFVAKLASACCKPDGLLVVPPSDVLEFLHPLPISALWGVGERTGQRLATLGLTTVGDLAHTPVSSLRHAVGRAVGEHLHALAWGRDPRRVVPDEPSRSVGAEQTFDTDVDDPRVIHRELLRLADRTAARLRAGDLRARTVSIKVRFADFTTITRSRTLGVPTDVSQEVYETVRDLFVALGLHRTRIRLVGVRAEGLVAAREVPEQLRLGDRRYGWKEADRAVDRAARRFGAGAVRPATLMSDHRAAEPHRPGADIDRDGEPQEF
ncbi:MAG TPA: DNA polymerase IV [Mycobacteriales bacterium]